MRMNKGLKRLTSHDKEAFTGRGRPKNENQSDSVWMPALLAESLLHISDDSFDSSHIKICIDSLRMPLALPQILAIFHLIHLAKLSHY